MRQGWLRKVSLPRGVPTLQFGIVVLRLRTALHFACAVFRVFAPPSPSAVRCSGAADALWAWPQFGMVVPHRSQARLRRSLVPTIRNSRLATLPLASLLCSLDFRFACFAHCARRSSVPTGLTTACIRHRRRPSCAPQSASPTDPLWGKGSLLDSGATA